MPIFILTGNSMGLRLWAFDFNTPTSLLSTKQESKKVVCKYYRHTSERHSICSSLLPCSSGESVIDLSVVQFCIHNYSFLHVSQSLLHAKVRIRFICSMFHPCRNSASSKSAGKYVHTRQIRIKGSQFYMRRVSCVWYTRQMYKIFQIPIHWYHCMK